MTCSTDSSGSDVADEWLTFAHLHVQVSVSRRYVSRRRLRGPPQTMHDRQLHCHREHSEKQREQSIYQHQRLRSNKFHELAVPSAIVFVPTDPEVMEVKIEVKRCALLAQAGGA